MTQESDGGPYGEGTIEVSSIRDSVLKRPSMMLGDLQDGSAYAGTVGALVHATLSWQIGANVGVKLKADNAVELYCYAGLPQGQKAHEHRWSRPIHIVTRELATFGDRSLDCYAIACHRMTWEIRDQFATGSALFQDGFCQSAAQSAPGLPGHLCLRVSLNIGTPVIAIASASIAQVARAIRYMSGPADAGYWGCVSIEDLRTKEKLDVLVTNPPPGPYWRELNDRDSA